MRIKIFWVIVLAILPFSYSDGDGQKRKSARSTEPLRLTIDFDQKYQTIKGFGASDAWSIQFVGKNWPLEKRNNIADCLFSTAMDSEGNPKGIGLSIWRFNIGAGSARQGADSGIEDPWRRTESFLRADSTYDWSKQQGQQWFMEAAQKRGVKTFIGFVNSPPLLLTKNGKAFGDGSAGANILRKHYDDFADYLAKIGRYFKKKGISLDYISPVNEPQWNWSQSNGQEGSPYQNDQISGIVKALDEKIRAYDLNTKIEIPEAAKINFLYDGDLSGRSRQIDYFFGPESGIKKLPTLAEKIAAHSYFTTWPVSDMIDQRRQLRESITNANVPLEYWMSEYCILADNKQIQGGERDLGMEPALYVARVLHYDMTIANASSWQWWLAVSPYDFKDGLVYIDKNKQNGSVFDSKILWALGNYSRFIRPGAVRLGVRRSDGATPKEAAQQIMASGYFHKELNQLSVVLINYSDTSRKVTIDLENESFRHISKIVPYWTSTHADLQRQEPITTGQNISIPARSIVTLQAEVER